MSRYSVDDDYCYPGTSVLRNKLNYQDQESLDRFEADITTLRMIELLESPITGNFDLSHLQKIHFHIFQDVYHWAGEIRTVDISRGESRFANQLYIKSSAAKLFEKLARDNRLLGLDINIFAEKAAYYLSEINAIHPFREGNGRAQRAFIAQLCNQAGYLFDYSDVEPAEFLKAMINAFNGDENLLGKIVRRSLTPV